MIHNQRAPINARSLRALSLFGVADVLQAPQDPPLREAGLRLVYDRRDARVYANSPRCRAHGWWARSRSWRARTGAGSGDRPRFMGRRQLVAEKPLAGLVRGRAPSSRAGSGAIASYGDERVRMRAASRGRGMLVVNDVDAPGWKATVDGRETPIERVNFLHARDRAAARRHTTWRWPTSPPASSRLDRQPADPARPGRGRRAALWRRRRGQAVR